MPIADMDDYENGHFERVYTHLIKPAVEKAGYDAIRADEVGSSNYIVIDILTKIVDSDMVLCDLSGRNPNVLYELGVRQAFNLPTVLIKDIKTNKIFDIQGLRYTEYNHILRIDTVQKNIEEIARSVEETEKAIGTDINSLIQLLGVKPATLPKNVELSDETSVLLSAIKDLSARIASLENHQPTTEFVFKPVANPFLKSSIKKGENGSYQINDESMSIGDTLHIKGNEIGQLVDVRGATIFVKNKKGEITKMAVSDPRFSEITTMPF